MVICIFQEKERSYARRLELSGSDPLKVATLAKDLFLDLRTPEEVNEVYKSTCKQGKSKMLLAEAFREAMSCVTATLKTPQ